MSKALIRAAAPFFKGQAWCSNTQAIKNLSLADFKGQYVLLFFYPLNFTFVCPTEIVEFSRRAKEFRDINCEVIGCSVDSVHSHREYTKLPRDQGGLGNLDINLLSDQTHQISKDYGVLLPDAGIALRGSFLIDQNQVLRHISVNDTPVGRNVDEYFRLLQAFQFNDKHGEVCPAKWTPGAATINPANPDVYWKKHHSKN